MQGGTVSLSFGFTGRYLRDKDKLACNTSLSPRTWRQWAIPGQKTQIAISFLGIGKLNCQNPWIPGLWSRMWQQ